VKKIWSLLLIVCCLLLWALPLQAQDEDPAAQFYALITEARLSAELPPYGWAPELNAAAQRHAQDLAANQLSSHEGSDGSTARERIADANYGAWDDGALVGENFFVGFGSAADAFDWFMGDAEHRRNILSASYREIGVGVATDNAGRNYYVLDFGARPNVLPVFINDGAAETESADVAIRLSNEEARPQGQGTLYVGRAIEIRVSNSREFDGLPWQTWEELVAWTLPAEPGERSVYIQFRDGAGRTTTSVDSIFLVPGEEAPSSPVSTASPSPEPSPPPVSAETPGAASPSPQAPTPPIALETPVTPPTSVASSTPAPVPAVTPTPFLTWTPLPSAAPETALAESPGPSLGWLCLAQAAAVLLGIYAALRRRVP
jgi:cell division septation protein DedD